LIIVDIHRWDDDEYSDINDSQETSVDIYTLHECPKIIKR